MSAVREGVAVFIGNPGEASPSDDWGAESNKRDVPEGQQRRASRGRDVGRRANLFWISRPGWMAGMWVWS